MTTGLIIVRIGGKARENFEDTIKKPWTYEELTEEGIELPKDLASKLKSVGEFRIWGAVGKGIVKWKEAWKYLDQNWIVAFLEKDTITCWGYIFAKIHDPSLAERLWGRDERGRTWEYIYFIKNLQYVNIPWLKVCSELGYAETFKPIGHFIVSDNIIKNIIKRYGSLENLLKQLSGETEIQGTHVHINERFNPYLLQGITYLGPRQYMLVLGRIVKELNIKREESLNKEEVKKVIEDHLRSLSISEKAIKELSDPRLLNDLRRLNLLDTGDLNSSWSSKEQAKITRISRMIDTGVDDIIVGALVIAIATYLAETPCTKILNKIWRKVSEDVVENIVNEISNKINISKDRVKQLIEKEINLLKEVKTELKRAPKFILPIELWGWYLD